MAEPSGELDGRTKVAGHTCFLFEPERPSEHGFTVIYLHCSHAAKLAAFPAFTARVRPARPARDRADHRAQLVDRPPLDRLRPDDHRRARTCSTASCRSSPNAGTRGRRSSRCLGVSMGGQGALRMAYKYPNIFPTVAAISPAIDFQKRIDEGVDPGLDEMYRDAEDARQDTATLHIHPLNWPRNQFFCCDPTDYRWHESADRLRMKLWSLGVPFECDLETDRRRPQLRVRLPHGAARGRLSCRAARDENGSASCERMSQRLRSRIIPNRCGPIAR